MVQSSQFEEALHADPCQANGDICAEVPPCSTLLLH